MNTVTERAVANDRYWSDTHAHDVRAPLRIEPAALRANPDRAPRRQGLTRSNHPARYWIRYDDATWTPVVDRVSRKLYETWKALETGRPAVAALKMRSVAGALRCHAVAAAQTDEGFTLAERKQAQFVSWRLASSALRAGVAATRLETGELRTKADVRTIVDAATWADIDRRWLVVGSGTWFPVCNSAQHHFTAAATLLAQHSTAAAIAEIRKALGYLRLEAARSSGYARLALDGVLVEFDEYVAPRIVEAPALQRPLNRQFARALLSLALGHRNRASECWLRHDLVHAGCEFVAAGEGLRHASAWIAGAHAAEAYRVALHCDNLGRRLQTGGGVHRDEVLRAVQEFSSSAADLQPKLAFTHDPSPSRERLHLSALIAG